MVIISVAVFGASYFAGKTFNAIATLIQECSTTRCAKTIFFAGCESSCAASALAALINQCIATEDTITIEVTGCESSCAIDADTAEVYISGSTGITRTIAGIRSGGTADAVTAAVEIGGSIGGAAAVCAAQPITFTDTACIFDSITRPCTGTVSRAGSVVVGDIFIADTAGIEKCITINDASTILGTRTQTGGSAYTRIAIIDERSASCDTVAITR